MASAASYTQGQLASLERLDCNSDDFSTEVNDLTGLEYATNLAEFKAGGADLSDVTPLSTLPLTDLTLDTWGGQAVDLTPIAGKSTLLSLTYSAWGATPQPIPSFPNLVELQTTGVPLSVISTSSLPKLSTLKFSGDGSTSDLSALPPLPELTELELDSIQLESIPTLALPKLASLKANYLGLSDISGLSSLPELTTLELDGNQLIAIPSSLDVPKLESASFRWNQISDLSGLSGMPELTNLDLEWNQLTDIPSTLSLPKLREAEFSGNQISSIATLPSMPSLQRLDLDHNQLTALPALSLPKLDWLGLAYNQISTISATTNVPELDGISLIGNDVTNLAPLKSYPVLSKVFVKGNHIADLSNLGTSYAFKGQLHATGQDLATGSAKACTLVPLPTIKGAPDSGHPIVWTLHPTIARSGSNVIFPDPDEVDTHQLKFSQLGRFTRSDSKDDIYFSGYRYVEVTKATAIYAPTPTVSGTARYGSKVSVGGGSWCPAATSRTFQWLRNGAPIARATGSTYTLTVADIGKKISVRVTGTRTGMSTVVKTSAQVAVAKGVLGAKTPAITGTAKKGKKLTVKMSAWTPAPVKISYQWLRNGKAIKKATKSSYKLTKKDRKKYISVRVTGTKTGYTTVSRTSAKTAKVK
ncbi:MAG: leucine-rich repeat domain-containing protein [Microlunatus sp.]